jgi:hypothetical protein
LNKTPTSCLTKATLAAGASTSLAEATIVNLTRAIAVVFQIEATYGSSCNDGLTLYLYPLSDNDDATVDTEFWDSWHATLSAGGTIRIHWPPDQEVHPLPAYMKVIVKNNATPGANTAITSITVRVIALNL